jgi:hypothetical protein
MSSFLLGSKAVAIRHRVISNLKHQSKLYYQNKRSIPFTFMHVQNVYICRAHLNNLTKHVTVSLID